MKESKIDMDDAIAKVKECKERMNPKEYEGMERMFILGMTEIGKVDTDGRKYINFWDLQKWLEENDCTFTRNSYGWGIINDVLDLGCYSD
jgi:hypothetical protein